MNTTTLRLLKHNDKELQDVLKPGSYHRTVAPDGFIVRLTEKASEAKVREQFRLLSHKEAGQLKSNVKLDTGKLKGAWVAAAVGGLLLGSYRPGRWKSEAKTHPLTKAGAEIDAGKQSKKTEALIAKEIVLADTQLSIIALVDAPANVKRPQYLAQWAVESGKKYGYSVNVLDEKACKKEGLGALLAVNRGSEDPARFIIMEYGILHEECGALMTTFFQNKR